MFEDEFVNFFTAWYGAVLTALSWASALVLSQTELVIPPHPPHPH